MRILALEYPVLPSTTNKLYIKGTILTATAREYKSRFKEYMTREYLSSLDVLGTNEENRHTVYGVHLRFYFESLINETYGDKTMSPSRRAKTLYKKIDVTNRVKLLEDCVRDLLSIDDSRTFVATQEKLMDPKHPRVEIYIDKLDPEYFGIPPEYLNR